MRGSKRASRCTGLRRHRARCWAPEGRGLRGAHQWMRRRNRGRACSRRHCWGGGVGRNDPAPIPSTKSHRPGGPLLRLGHRLPTLPGTPACGTHGNMDGGVSLSHSPSDGRTASLALASCLLAGAGCGLPRWLGHDFSALPPSTYGEVPRWGRGAGTAARERRGRFWLHLGRAH